MTDRLLPAFTACAPELSQYVIGEVFGDVDQMRTPEWARLIETVAAYVDCDGSIELTAKHLYLHRNTVHQRLRTVQRITGRDLRSPRQAAELILAVEAYRLYNGTPTAPLATSECGHAHNAGLNTVRTDLDGSAAFRWT